jgi:hypothetical protein
MNTVAFGRVYAHRPGMCCVSLLPELLARHSIYTARQKGNYYLFIFFLFWFTFPVCRAGVNSIPNTHSAPGPAVHACMHAEGRTCMHACSAPLHRRGPLCLSGQMQQQQQHHDLQTAVQVTWLSRPVPSTRRAREKPPNRRPPTSCLPWTG